MERAAVTTSSGLIPTLWLVDSWGHGTLHNFVPQTFLFLVIKNSNALETFMFHTPGGLFGSFKPWFFLFQKKSKLSIRMRRIWVDHEPGFHPWKPDTLEQDARHRCCHQCRDFAAITPTGKVWGEGAELGVVLWTPQLSMHVKWFFVWESVFEWFLTCDTCHPLQSEIQHLAFPAKSRSQFTFPTNPPPAVTMG